MRARAYAMSVFFAYFAFAFMHVCIHSNVRAFKCARVRMFARTCVRAYRPGVTHVCGHASKRACIGLRMQASVHACKSAQKGCDDDECTGKRKRDREDGEWAVIMSNTEAGTGRMKGCTH